MLSFMKDTQDNLAGTESVPNAEQGTGEDFLTVQGHEQRTRQSTLVFIVTFMVGVAGLFYMVKRAQPMAAVAAETDTEEAQIEAAITRLTGVSTEMMTHMDEIVARFHEFENIQQIRVEELVKNPFSLEIFGSAVPEEVIDEAPAVDPVLLLANRAQQNAQELELLSILQEGGSCRCMINDTICQQGDIVMGFEVLAIGTNQVLLRWIPDQELSDEDLNKLTVTLKLTE